jgi:hypothetical protein
VVLTGQQPDLRKLRGGYFADRRLYDELAREALEWISAEQQPGREALGIPVLWIAGRSGSGKSVALLHLLSRLNEEGVGPILWLGQGVELLPDAVRRLPGLAAPGEQIILAMDDPYAPRTQQDGEHWRSALRTLQLRPEARPPLIICCGLTDQARGLNEDFGADVGLHITKIPNRLDDLTELRAWYSRRTGAPPPEIGNGDVLLV